jgi:hypothetical protein
MNKINFYLESRLLAVKKRAAEYSKHNPDGAYKSALEHQVKYKRKGWIKYDSANSYNEEGDLYLYSLDDFDGVPIQDISRRRFDYSGYYADNFQCELIKPYIVKIKTSKGLFIAPAIAYSDSDIATIYFSQGEFSEDHNIDSDISYKMAGMADSIAERLAEQGRDDDAKYQAEQETENLKAENEEARKEAHTLIVAIRDQRDIGAIVGPICNALMNDIKALRQTIRANNQRVSALKNDYWLSVN